MAQHLLRHSLFLNLHEPAFVPALYGWRGMAPGPFTAKRPALFRQGLLALVRGASLGPTCAGLVHSNCTQSSKFLPAMVSDRAFRL